MEKGDGREMIEECLNIMNIMSLLWLVVEVDRELFARKGKGLCRVTKVF